MYPLTYVARVVIFLHFLDLIISLLMQVEDVLLKYLNQNLFLYGANTAEGEAAQAEWDEVQRTVGACMQL